MEIVYAIVGFAAVMLGLWGLSHYLFRVRGPKRDVPRILNALSHAEQVGASDVSTNIKVAAERYRLIRLGLSDKKLRKPIYNLAQYYDRMEAQMQILKPHEKALRDHLGRNNWWMSI